MNMKKIPKMDAPAVYRISVGGRLEPDWSDRLEGMTICVTGEKGSSEKTVLEGRLPDQAALSGVLNTLYELHLPVLSVDCLETNASKEGG